MEQRLDRLTIRSVDVETKAMLKTLNRETRMPMALLIEEAVTLLWDSYHDDNHEYR